MTYTALYREWRPRTFSEVVGQEHITRTLQNALTSNRVAHAYLFTGPRGTGKTSVAKILAKAVNCQEGATEQPCDKCAICKSITQGSSMDVIEIDAASNRGIGEIRELKDKIRYSPTECRKKVYIVDEVHMLTAEAFNALLKTLEEPPAHAMFVLATTEPRKVPPTILSRCQRFDFHKLSPVDVKNRLKDVADSMSASISTGALDAIARRSDGSLRDAIGLLDQCAVYARNEVTEDHVLEVLGGVARSVIHELIQSVAANDLPSVLIRLHRLSQDGVDVSQLLEDVRDYLRDLLVLASVKDTTGLVDIPDADTEIYRQQALAMGKERLLEALELLAKAQREIRYSGRPNLWLELFFIRLAKGSSGTEEQPQSRSRPKSKGKPVSEQEPVLNAEAAAPSKGKKSGGPSRLTLDQVRKSWPEILVKIRKSSVPLHALCVESTPEALDGNRLTLGFPMAFHKGAMEKGSNSKLLEQALQDILGCKLRVAYQLSGETDIKPGSTGTDEGSSAETQSPVDLITEVFGGEIVRLDDIKGGS